jgi:hypothetical protein
MLTKNSFYKVPRTNSIWIKAADCAAVLKIRSNNFLKYKVVKKMGPKNFYHINEETFKEVFANDLQALSLLNLFKETGAIPAYENVYSHICGGLYQYLPLLPQDTFRQFPEAPGLPLSILFSNIKQKNFQDLSLSIHPIIYLYTKILVYKSPSHNNNKLNETPMYCAAKKIKDTYPLFHSYSVKSLLSIFEGKYPKDLVKGLKGNWEKPSVINLLSTYEIGPQLREPLDKLNDYYYNFPIISFSSDYVAPGLFNEDTF